MDDYTFGYGTSIVLAVLFAWVLLPGVTIVAARSAIGRLRTAAALRRASTRKFDGRAGPTVVRGRVAWIDPERPPVEIVVEQIGSESEHGRTGNVSTVWEEQARRVRLEPFDVVLPDDSRVRIEPDGDTLLADQLDEVRQIGVSRREKRAALDQGEEVWVVGAMRPPSGGERTVDSAYRGAIPGDRSRPKRLVLRSSPLDRMVLSTSPPGRDHWQSVVLHTMAALVFAVGTIVLNTVVLGDFYRLAVSGHRVDATVVEPIVDMRYVSTWKGGGYTESHYKFRVEYVDSSGAKQTPLVEVDRTLLDEYKLESEAGKPYRLELTVTDGAHPLARLGAKPGASGWLLIVGGWAVVLALFYAWAARMARPWYARAKLNEAESGPIPRFDYHWTAQQLSPPSRARPRVVAEPAPLELSTVPDDADVAMEDQALDEHVVTAAKRVAR